MYLRHVWKQKALHSSAVKVNTAFIGGAFLTFLEAWWPDGGYLKNSWILQGWDQVLIQRATPNTFQQPSVQSTVQIPSMLRPGTQLCLSSLHAHRPPYPASHLPYLYLSPGIMLRTSLCCSPCSSSPVIDSSLSQFPPTHYSYSSSEVDWTVHSRIPLSNPLPPPTPPPGVFFQWVYIWVSCDLPTPPSTRRKAFEDRTHIISISISSESQCLSLNRYSIKICSNALNIMFRVCVL